MPKLPPQIVRNFPVSRRYLVGVSGGRDSVALLHLLTNAGFRKLVVCHLDHQLRGRSSTADARFVRRLADTLGLEFEGAEADVRTFAQEHRQSIETAARTMRYAFFVDVARRRRCRTVFLAHHADDLVETYLFNLFRGASGGRSMQPMSVHKIGRTALTIVRPLLHVWRRDIDTYLLTHGVGYREDASNATVDRTRNRMRHKIIPFLEKEFGRGIRESIWRAAMIGSAEDALLESMLPSTSQALDVRSLGEQPLALQRRAIRNWLRAQAVPDISFDLVESVRGLLEVNTGPAKVNLPRAQHVRRRAGELFIE